MAAGDQYRLLMADVYELAGLSRRTSEAIARDLGQTAARWHVLSVLSAGPCTVPAAARPPPPAGLTQSRSPALPAPDPHQPGPARARAAHPALRRRTRTAAAPRPHHRRRPRGRQDHAAAAPAIPGNLGPEPPPRHPGDRRLPVNDLDGDGRRVSS